MKVGLLQVGQIDQNVLVKLQQGLVKIFPETVCTLMKDVLSIPERALDRKRKQYNSSVILSEVRACVDKKKEIDRVLAVVDKDIFVPELNYVFGEAYVPGKAALISLWRLRAEFYHERENMKLFLERALKEAVHELGHTLGLQHCPRSFCVMHFSNSIFDTDKKANLFCDQHNLQAAIAINNLG